MHTHRPVLTGLLAMAVLLLPGTAGAQSPSAPAVPGSPAPSVAASPGASSIASAAPIARLRYEVVARRPHDSSAWTQGLLFDADGRLFEGTGITGESSVRELDPVTGAVLRSTLTPDGMYGEGLALVGDRALVQITWQDGVATMYDKESFTVLDTFRYSGQGWGLCFDGRRLVMSDGTGTLTFRDPATFAVLGTVEVTAGRQPVIDLNELECVDGAVWANLWETDWIVRIDPVTGAVTGALDTTGLLVPHPRERVAGAWPNGIAKVPGTDTWLLTGKLWPQMIEVRITEG